MVLLMMVAEERDKCKVILHDHQLSQWFKDRRKDLKYISLENKDRSIQIDLNYTFTNRHTIINIHVAPE